MNNQGSYTVPTSMKLMSPSIEAIMGKPKKAASLLVDTQTKSNLNINKMYVALEYPNASIRLYDHKATVKIGREVKYFGHFQLKKLLMCIAPVKDNPFTEFFTTK